MVGSILTEVCWYRLCLGFPTLISADWWLWRMPFESLR